MTLPRCLITGGGGQLGQDLARLSPGSTAPTKAELSIENLDAVRQAIVGSGAEVVFNCAAYNAVDAAEDAPDRAMSVNAIGAGNVARACRLEGVRLVHFSTNYVFDGRRERPYSEADAPNPLSVYGRSKLEGEERVRAELPDALVIRSSGLFGVAGSAVKGGSLPDRLLARAEQAGSISVVTDQKLNPTYTGHLAEASIAALEAGRQGLLHLVADGCCSVYDLAVELLHLASVAAEVRAIETPTGGAARPANGCLVSTFVGPLPHWREGLAAYWQARSATRRS